MKYLTLAALLIAIGCSNPTQVEENYFEDFFFGFNIETNIKIDSMYSEQDTIYFITRTMIGRKTVVNGPNKEKLERYHNDLGDLF